MIAGTDATSAAVGPVLAGLLVAGAGFATLDARAPIPTIGAVDPGVAGIDNLRMEVVWHPPYYTVHGTEAEQSLGEAASHGSIRASPTDMREVEIPDPIPFTVSE
jgi:hypothetical protein